MLHDASNKRIYGATTTITFGTTTFRRRLSPLSVLSDDRSYTVRLSRAAGIEWGTDLSFRFVYVRALEPGGAADQTGVISKGDQLCSIRPLNDLDDRPATIVVGAPFDFVMDTFANLNKTVREVELEFLEEPRKNCKRRVAPLRRSQTL